MSNPLPQQQQPDNPRDLLSRELRRLREGAGLSLAQAGRVANCDRTYLSRIERSEHLPSASLTAALDAAYGTAHLLPLRNLALRSVYPNFVRRYMELEQKATKLHQYMNQVMPGLLQTEEYTRALLRISRPRDTEEHIEELVTTRVERQSLLSDQPVPLLWVVLDETVFRREVGSPEVMRDQCLRLLDAARSPHIVLQVLPFSAKAHALMGGSLTLLDLPKGTDIAYLENSHTGELVEDPSSVADYSLAYDLLRTSALTQEDSIRMIGTLAKEIGP